MILKILLSLILSLNAEVNILPYKTNFSWQAQWSKELILEIREQKLTSFELNADDLNVLSCPGYKLASELEREDFWVNFFSALTRAESAFNPRAVSGGSKGPRSYGLLQIAKLTAKSRCQLHNVFSPSENLKCGVKLMRWQLEGAPISFNKKLRPDLLGHLFGKKIFQWGPLRQDDLSGRKLLLDWFIKHLGQMPFCSKT